MSDRLPAGNREQPYRHRRQGYGQSLVVKSADCLIIAQTMPEGKMKKIAWKSEKRRLAVLRPMEENPRKASEKQRGDVMESIQRFNLADPFIINTDNKVVGGNLRLDEMIKKFGVEHTVDVRVPDRKLTEKQVRELNLRLNKNTGEWDFDILKTMDWNVLNDVGFDSEELEAAFGLEVNEDDFDVAKEVQKIIKPVSKYGDIYELGENRVMCGDSRKEEDVKGLMDGETARLVFTDPPYNVDYESADGNSYAEGKFKHKKVFDDNLSHKDCLEFYSRVLKNLYKFTTRDACIYWWYAHVNYAVNQQAFANAGWRMSQSLVWVKNGMTLRRLDYQGCYEPCMYGWKKGKKHYCHQKIRNLKDVMNLDFEDFVLLMDFWYEKRDITVNYVHPTQKPVRLAERAVKKSSKKGDIVLDVFGGSGSTLIGCEQMGRACYTMELDPVYVDVIVKRWEEFTRRKGKLVNGKHGKT